jgi:hypothetical protein
VKKMAAWLTVATLATAVGVAVSGESRAADDVPAASSLVEDFTHPGAATILAQHDLKVLKGDGHIVFTEAFRGSDGQCAAGEVQVEKLMGEDPFSRTYCFKTIGSKGVLTMEVPGTFGIRGGSKPIEATAELPDGKKAYDIDPNEFVPVDPGSTSDLPEAILVELRIAAG